MAARSCGLWMPYTASISLALMPPLFMHDMQSRWNEIAAELGIDVARDAGDRLIVDDILSYARSFIIALAYLECQLRVCRAQNLS
eukprot:scaffold51757_cov42-Cyclotella_meneghiniana.AAC.1